MSFKSRSGRYASFKDAIDREGVERFDGDWLRYTCYRPATTLPALITAASKCEVDFAIALLRTWDPEIIFQIQRSESNDSVPSFLCPSGIDIQLTGEQWSRARALSVEIRERMIEADKLLKCILEEFADAAANGQKRTFVRSASSCETRELEAEYWDVDVDVILARYQTSTLEVRSSIQELAKLQSVDQGSSRSTAANIILNDWQRLIPNQRYLILVGQYFQDSVTDVDDKGLEEKEALFRERLALAARENPDLPPAGSLLQLHEAVRKQLGCSLKRAKQIVAETPVQNWHRRGRKKNVTKKKGNSILLS